MKVTQPGFLAVLVLVAAFFFIVPVVGGEEQGPGGAPAFHYQVSLGCLLGVGDIYYEGGLHLGCTPPLIPLPDVLAEANGG